MDTLELGIEITVPNLSGMDAQKIIDAWHTHAGEVMDLEEASIGARTPSDTGALLSALTGVPNPGGDILTSVFYDDGPQLAQWHRVYAQYQEGGALGLPTYTNPPREMIGRADPEDLPQIEDWAIRTAQDAVDLFTSGSYTIAVPAY